MEQQVFLFDHIFVIRDELAWPGLALTPHDGFIFSQFKRYKVKTLKQTNYRYKNCCIKFSTEEFRFSLRQFLPFGHVFLFLVQEPLVIFEK